MLFEDELAANKNLIMYIIKINWCSHMAGKEEKVGLRFTTLHKYNIDIKWSVFCSVSSPLINQILMIAKTKIYM